MPVSSGRAAKSLLGRRYQELCLLFLFFYGLILLSEMYTKGSSSWAYRAGLLLSLSCRVRSFSFLFSCCSGLEVQAGPKFLESGLKEASESLKNFRARDAFASVFVDCLPACPTSF